MSLHLIPSLSFGILSLKWSSSEPHRSAWQRPAQLLLTVHHPAHFPDAHQRGRNGTNPTPCFTVSLYCLPQTFSLCTPEWIFIIVSSWMYVCRCSVGAFTDICRSSLGEGRHYFGAFIQILYGRKQLTELLIFAKFKDHIAGLLLSVANRMQFCCVAFQNVDTHWLLLLWLWSVNKCKQSPNPPEFTVVFSTQTSVFHLKEIK